MGEICFITDEAAFDEVLATGLTLVNFTAAWCGPCKRFAPVLEELADDLAGQLQIVKVDIDEAPAIKDRYNIMGVPSSIVFEGAEPMVKLIGAHPKAKVLELVSPLL
jgi:thioredoxin 1